MCAAGYRVPAMAPRGATFPIWAIWSAVNGSAASASLSCSRVRMPSVGVNFGSLPSTYPCSMAAWMTAMLFASSVLPYTPDIPTLEVVLAEALQALVATRGVRSDHSRPVRRALAFIRERLEESISLEELATHVDLDKFHLCRAFRAQVGMPPHAYLTHLRVARAKELLTRGVRPSELAPLVGFYDQAQLTRHFRRLVGTTPARYVKSPGDPRFRGVLRPSPQP